MPGRTTMGTMLRWIERPFQTTVTRERSFLVDQANKIRRMLYDMYREYEIEVDVEECFQIQDFGHCSGCDQTSKGVTLPPYMQNVEAAWATKQPLLLYSKWREYKTGIHCSNDCLRAVYDLPGRHSVEREPCPYNANHSIQFLAQERVDAGKKVLFSYRDEQGSQHKDDITLASSGYVPAPRLVSRIDSVILPDGLAGGVVIAQRDKSNQLRILSEYQPWEKVPSYRRVKITGVGVDEVVVLRASRTYTDLYSDTDIVETDNRVVIENLARWLFYSESGAGDGLMQKASDHLQIAKDALRGENSRDLGVGKEGDLIPTQPLRRHRLHSRRAPH